MDKSWVMTVRHEVSTILKTRTHNPIFHPQVSISYIQEHKLRLARLHALPDFFLAQNHPPLFYV